ncbi:hypothetical protein AX768_05930 [Burkholderia sp. PAMC 28687]|jgi:hypothetical protein|uniref:Extracytoplasmic function alternative sigma factor n=1 Tax=Caballeronia sordidicola TaxID=196367 RepID=A0A242N7H6_CABSO|nr:MULTISPECIES: DUF1109 domain-containing protein [Burkholderiaceae]AMM13710.1 hypothetical protein AX768_05930 [Burkholderia sp. PAMC 28687]OTP66663.1 extracytoplasmic function alternative sigma factor [Caballeronia sordidicola]OTP79364.1 extracytoplasmic function alternative sigma factor [Caballeronia sordidicola]
MKTDDLISLLSTGVTPVDTGLSRRRFVRALLLGGMGSFVLMLAVYGLRHDLAVVSRTPLFWARFAFPATLAACALFLAARLSRPGTSIGAFWAMPAVPILVVWSAAVAVLCLASPDARIPLVMGTTWRSCPFNIVLLSVPAFVAVFWAIRGLAPTRLRLAGAAGGMLAGTIATMAYCLHCPEMSVAFWAVWYLLGMTLATLIGALLGPRFLRW